MMSGLSNAGSSGSEFVASTRRDSTADEGGGGAANVDGDDVNVLPQEEDDVVVGPTRQSLLALPAAFARIREIVSKARAELPLDSIAMATLVELFERHHGFVNCSLIAEVLIACNTELDIQSLIYAVSDAANGKLRILKQQLPNEHQLTGGGCESVALPSVPEMRPLPPDM